MPRGAPNIPPRNVDLHCAGARVQPDAAMRLPGEAPRLAHCSRCPGKSWFILARGGNRNDNPGALGASTMENRQKSFLGNRFRSRLGQWLYTYSLFCEARASASGA